MKKKFGINWFHLILTLTTNINVNKAINNGICN
jgi:hypothetical protein